MKNKRSLRCLCEGAIFIAMALVLSYIKIPIGLSFGGFGGSINLVMVPLVVYAVRWGLWQGVFAGLVFGTMKFFFAEGFAINWVSIVFDYSLAYMAVGLAGIFKAHKNGLVLGGLIGCAGRFVIHFISGITVYSDYMPEEFMNLTITNPWMYSLLYNGTYMLPNTVLVVLLGLVLSVPLKRYVLGEDLPEKN